MSEISERLRRRIARDFQGEQVEAVVSLVSRVSDTERVQVAIVLALPGTLLKFRQAQVWQRSTGGTSSQMADSLTRTGAIA